MTDVVSMGRRKSVLEIAAPLEPRLKARLERATTQAILNPSRALPTLRRAVIAATAELRLAGFDDERIRSVFDRLIEDVARARALDTTSIVSGQPRWAELATRVQSWTSI